LFLLAGCGQVPPSGVMPTPPAVTATVQPSATPTPTPAPLPDGSVLAADLAKVPTTHLGQTAIVVADAQGNPLYSRGVTPMTPASTTKLLTAMASLDVLGADTRYQTTVVSAKPGAIVLVGGGDPLLTNNASTLSYEPASLADLASQTATALKASKITSVILSYDASLFTGPSWAPSWKDDWKSYQPRVSALEDNGGMRDAWNSQPDPAKSTAQDFAKHLAKDGVPVKNIVAGKAPAGAATIASVTSAPLSDMVSEMILNSNNLTAETLARHVGLAVSGQASFTGGSAAIESWLKGHGLWAAGMKIDGGSGLSSLSKIDPTVLAKAVADSLADAEYSPIVDGLPQAGVSGTLAKRFNEKTAKAGQKVVHAKTGTLSGVYTLAGYVTTKDGATLTFAAMVNKSAGYEATALTWIDTSAALLAGCGCRTS